MRSFSRRHLLQWVGAAAAVGCGSSSSSAPAKDGGSSVDGDGGVDPNGGGGDDAGADGPTSKPTNAQLLAQVEHIVVVMMENRSFDHYFGSLKADPAYPSAAAVDGLVGNETNPDPNGTPVQVWNQTSFVIPDLPHEWDDARAQYDNGKNDGFVKRHAGANQNDAMGYHVRAQLPFLYWLADNFVLCDRWYSSVLGPTWPNRFYLHAGTSTGKKDNSPVLQNEPQTIWEALTAAGKTAYNYHAGGVSWFTGAFPGKVLKNIDPSVDIGRFFSDASQGTLPDFCVIDPDFNLNDDHPPHDIRLGQVFLHSIYNALATGKSWEKTLLVITFDENGGLYDHVAPPSAVDDDADFRQYGFRVPSLVIGPMVKKGAIVSTVLDHTSVLATVKNRFGAAPQTQRVANASDLASCLDPGVYLKPRPPPAGAPIPKMQLRDVDRQNPRLLAFLARAQKMGSVRIVP